MKWTKDNLPALVSEWSQEDQAKALDAANSVVEAGGTEDHALFACLHVAGKSELAKARAGALVDGWRKSMETLELMREIGIEAIYNGVRMPARVFFKDKDKSNKGSYELDAEIFAVGKWNGRTFSLQDLQEIAANFEKLAEVHKVPLKFGHNSAQPLTDGQPALGWVSKVWVDGEKLMAHFVKLPEVVFNSVKAKLYRKVSIELDLDVEHKGSKYNYVLSGVALLGADLPAVNTLADLDTYIDGAKLSASRRVEFSAIGGRDETETQEGNDMPLSQEEVQALIEKATQPIIERNKVLEYENAKVLTRLTQMQAEAEETQKAEKAEKVKKKRAEVKAYFEGAVKQGVITPARREVFLRTFKVDDDEAVLQIDLEEVKAIVGGEIKMDFGSGKAMGNGGGEGSGEWGQGGGGGSGQHRRICEDAGEEIDRLAKIEMTRMAKPDYAAAKEIVLNRFPDLGREYIQSGEAA